MLVISPALWKLIITFAIIYILSKLQRKPSLIAHARWAGRLEEMAAHRIAKKQSLSKKVDTTALYLGEIETNSFATNLRILLTGRSCSIPFPFMQRSAIIFGSPGVGKTDTFCLPLAKDIIKRNLGSVIIFDPKLDLAPVLAPFGEAYRYRNYFLSPGQPYTDSINILDFLDREQFRSSIAEQAAITAVRNTKPPNSGKTDNFFGPSGEALVRSVLLMAKETSYPDLATVKEILSLDQLPERIIKAEAEGKISSWTADSFRQFLSGLGSERTIGGIKMTASLVFERFIRPEYINAFANQTNIPLSLDERQLLFIQPMRGFEDVCLPLLATIIDLLIEHNFSGPRTKPLFLIIDEKHLLYLPRLERWLAFLRSSGLVTIMLTQAMSQLRGRYGQNELNTILTSTGTKIFMNPDDLDTSQFAATKLGEREVRISQKSRSHSKSGTSTSDSQQLQKTPLMTADQINSMDVGEFICWNMGRQSGSGQTLLGGKKATKVSIPFHTKFEVPDSEFDLYKKCRVIWKDKMLPGLVKRAQKRHFTQEQINWFPGKRARLVRDLFPPPDENSDEPAATPSQSNTGKAVDSNSLRQPTEAERGILDAVLNDVYLP